MCRAGRRWVWAGRITFSVIVAGLVCHLIVVGLDKADKVASSFLAGMESTARELEQVFTRHGITRIDAMGEQLDPEDLAAVMNGAFAFMNASVLLPGRTLPFTVPTSFACEGITAAGLTSTLITYAASVGPVLKMSPIFMTASLGL